MFRDGRFPAISPFFLKIFLVYWAADEGISRISKLPIYFVVVLELSCFYVPNGMLFYSLGWIIKTYRLKMKTVLVI